MKVCQIECSVCVKAYVFADNLLMVVRICSSFNGGCFFWIVIIVGFVFGPRYILWQLAHAFSLWALFYCLLEINPI